MKLAIAALALLLLSCTTISEPNLPAEEMTWEQYESIEPGMKASEIRGSFGHPNEIRRDEGGAHRYTYYCWDENEQSLRTVDLEFDSGEILVEKSVL